MIRRYLDMLFGAEPDTSLTDLRWKVPGEPMCREFVPCRAHDVIAAAIAGRSAGGDVYVGVAPRERTEPQTGGAEAVERSHVLWVDCDTPESVEALRRFAPRPSMIVRSGSGGVHAYWALAEPIDPQRLVRANRRLAHHLGADLKATDPARILRPPGTRNFKHDPPKPVEVARFEDSIHSAGDLVRMLPDPPVERRRVSPVVNPGSELERIPAETYFLRLTGQEPDREGKVTCPIPDHPDRTPSCHLYERDWTCFGCGRGGTIYHLAGHLWGLEPRGAGFKEIKVRLEHEFGLVPV